MEISLVWNSYRLASIQKYIYHLIAETIYDFKAAISWYSENYSNISAICLLHSKLRQQQNNGTKFKEYKYVV